MSDHQFYIVLVAAITRGTVLVISAISGMICIYLGWKLYRDSVISSATGEASGPGFRVKLASAGPGIFFVAFGAWLLMNAASHPFSISGTDSPQQMNWSTEGIRPGFFAVADNRALAASGPAPTAACLIHSWQMSFFDGLETPSAEQISDALNSAIREYQIRASEDSEVSKAAPKNIDVLRYLSRGIVK